MVVLPGTTAPCLMSLMPPPEPITTGSLSLIWIVVVRATPSEASDGVAVAIVGACVSGGVGAVAGSDLHPNTTATPATAKMAFTGRRRMPMREKASRAEMRHLQAA